MNTFGKEDVSYISNQFLDDIVEKKDFDDISNGIVELCKLIWFNSNNNCNRVIKFDVDCGDGLGKLGPMKGKALIHAGSGEWCWEQEETVLQYMYAKAHKLLADRLKFCSNDGSKLNFVRYMIDCQIYDLDGLKSKVNL
jgi:hypothetical protein